MSQAEITALLNSLPDEWIDSAAAPQKRKPISLLRTVPAIAACLAVLIAAAVYPRLRGTTPPRVPETTAAVTQSVTTSVTESGQSTSQTGQPSGTVPTTASETGLSDSQSASAVFTTETTASGSSSGQQTAVTTGTAVTTVPDSASRTTTTTTGQESTGTEHTTIEWDLTGECISTEETVPYSVPVVTIPLRRWEDITDEVLMLPNTVTADFRLFTALPQEDDLPEWLPPDFDFAENDCLVVSFESNCADLAVTGIRLEGDSAVLAVSCLDAVGYQDGFICCYTLKIPKNLNINRKRFRAEYRHMTDDAVFRGLVKEYLILG